MIVLESEMVKYARRCKALFFLVYADSFVFVGNRISKGQRIKEYMSRWGMCLFKLPRLGFESVGGV